MLNLISPGLMVLVAMVWAVFMDRLAYRQRPDKDCGDYWGRIVVWYFYPMAVLLLLSQLVSQIPAWPKNISLYLDHQIGATGNDYKIALLIPFLSWAFALFLGLLLKPELPDKARWIAGGVSFNNSRYWLLWCALLLVLIVALNAGNLGAGEIFYPSALWGTLVVAVLTLVGVALSTGELSPPLPLDRQDEEVLTAGQPLQPWPDLMKAVDIQVSTLLTWQNTHSKRHLKDPFALFLADSLQDRGAKGVAPELIEAAAALIKPGQSATAYDDLHLVLAPDACGQIEIISLLALLLDQQCPTVTLLITADDADELAKNLRRCSPEVEQRIAVLGYGEVQESALIWIVNAQMLSDRLLMHLKDSPRIIRCIGLVVWWQLQNYSGVMAANLWAISRRLHRLLRFHGRHDLRNLASMRIATEDAQQSDFVRRLLPYAKIIKTHVPMQAAQTLSLHRLDKQSALERQYLLLQAAAASVTGKWATHLMRPDFISTSEWTEFGQQTIAGKKLAEQLSPVLPEAGVVLLQVQAAGLLALPGMVIQSGRSRLDLPLQHVGIMPSANPYISYLLGVLAKDKKFTTSRRLICAQSCPAVIRRHLFFGLNELPDTRLGLLQNSLWEQRVVNETLQHLANEGKLSKKEVRFLDYQGRLSVDFEYRSQRIPPDHYSPLDTVGQQLVEVRERAGGSEDGGIRLCFDPERLLIKAYPGCVFMCQGQRYRIRDWNASDLKQHASLECVREDACYSTWRIHTATVFGFKPLPDKTTEVAIGKQGRLERLAVKLKYQEEITGRIEWTIDALKNPMAEPTRIYYTPLRNTFKTCALVLRLVYEPNDQNALPSLCQALRYVLPVHLGVEEDALEVVCLNGEEINGRATFGIAIVDLYPEGIGLIDAIYDDNSLLLDILQWTRNWLMVCPDQALQTPMSLATNLDLVPQTQAALDLLNQIV